MSAIEATGIITGAGDSIKRSGQVVGAKIVLTRRAAKIAGFEVPADPDGYPATAAVCQLIVGIILQVIVSIASVGSSVCGISQEKMVVISRLHRVGRSGSVRAFILSARRKHQKKAETKS